MEKKSKVSFKLTTRQITVTGMLSAVSIILSVTQIGFIKVPPFVDITIMHVPVIIGAILEGPIVGALVGLIFGIFSMIQAIIQPGPFSFIFLNPIVSVIPRVAIGITTYYAYKLLKTRFKFLRIGFAASIGTITNTVGVLGFMYLIYLKSIAEISNMGVVAATALIAALSFQGIFELIFSILISIPIVMAMEKIRK